MEAVVGPAGLGRVDQEASAATPELTDRGRVTVAK
jgi:hypothetical protein